jgi:hypothetical protein
MARGGHGLLKSFTRARHALPFYGRLRGGLPTGQAVFGRFLPLWTPQALRLWTKLEQLFHGLIKAPHILYGQSPLCQGGGQDGGQGWPPAGWEAGRKSINFILTQNEHITNHCSVRRSY